MAKMTLGKCPTSGELPFHRLQYCIEHTVVRDGADVLVRGSEALKEKYSHFMKSKAVTIEDAKPFNAFSHLLKESELAKVREKVADVVKSGQAAASSSSSSAAASAVAVATTRKESSKQKSRKKASKEDERAGLNALFE